jgi:rubrerythrin
MSLSIFLDNCAQIENLVGQIYYIFMEQQSSTPELAKLWEKTADEEQNHEQQFQMAKRLYKSIASNPEISNKKLEAIINELVHLKERIVAKPLSPVESIRLAIDIEEKLAEYHLDNIPLFSDESLNSLFKSMMNNDQWHVENLRNALETYKSIT